jgi:DNA invertase Pin-like site-specific DNA recombinase
MLDMGLRPPVYSRTSTQNGAGSDSLTAQEDGCRGWAAGAGHEVVATFRDDALSGSLRIEDRPGLGAALLAIEDGTVDGLVVHRVDRLARELHVQEVAIMHAWNVGEHVEVFEAIEGGAIKRDDPDDPHRGFLRQVMGTAAELERGLVRARLQGGRRRKAARGGYVGGKRLHRRNGYDVVNGEYVPREDEQVVTDASRGCATLGTR